MTAEYLGVMVALGGLTATVLVFIVQLRTSIRFQRAEYVYRLNEKYDQLCRFRCEHPKLMEFAKPWAEKAMNQMTLDERAYYYYAGMTLGVLETAVYSTFVARTLSLRDFQEYVRPMLLQEVQYNLPVFRWFAERGFLAAQSKRILQEMLLQIDRTSSPDALPTFRDHPAG